MFPSQLFQGDSHTPGSPSPGHQALPLPAPPRSGQVIAGLRKTKEGRERRGRRGDRWLWLRGAACPAQVGRSVG